MGWRPRFPKKKPELHQRWTYENFPHSLSEFLSGPNSAYGTNQPNNVRSYGQRSNQSFNKNDGTRSRNGYFNNQNGNWRKTGIFSHSPSFQRKDFSQNSSYCQPKSDQPNNSVFGRSDNRPTTSFMFWSKGFHKTTTRRHPMWSASPQVTAPLTNYQTFARLSYYYY